MYERVLAAQVWPNGCIRLRCPVTGAHFALKGKSARPGLYKCTASGEPFTVTVGSVFERSKIAINVWLQAIYLLFTNNKGISAKQLERMLGVTGKHRGSGAIASAKRGGRYVTGAPVAAPTGRELHQGHHRHHGRASDLSAGRWQHAN